MTPDYATEVELARSTNKTVAIIVAINEVFKNVNLQLRSVMKSSNLFQN